MKFKMFWGLNLNKKIKKKIANKLIIFEIFDITYLQFSANCK